MGVGIGGEGGRGVLDKQRDRPTDRTDGAEEEEGNEEGWLHECMRAGRESCYRIHFLLHCSRALDSGSAYCRFCRGVGPFGKSGEGVDGMIFGNER